MRLSQKVLKKRFKIFNERYFGGQLVEPDFVITGSRWTAGMFNSKVYVEKDEDGEDYASELVGIKIRLSKYLIKNSTILDNILLHEMIHYYGYYSNADIEGEHGDFFLDMAEEINSDGYNIQKYYEE
jgi:hypothetical protein